MPSLGSPDDDGCLYRQYLLDKSERLYTRVPCLARDPDILTLEIRLFGENFKRIADFSFVLVELSAIEVAHATFPSAVGQSQIKSAIAHARRPRAYPATTAFVTSLGADRYVPKPITGISRPSLSLVFLWFVGSCDPILARFEKDFWNGIKLEEYLEFNTSCLDPHLNIRSML